MNTKPRLAVLQFPGLNCEYETQRAAAFYGFDAKIFRWNDHVDELDLADAFIVPGGFSFQDRVRAGAIAAKLPVMAKLAKADQDGKPILGICNGCQILAEAGLFPNLSPHTTAHRLQVALAPNSQENRLIGHICDWVDVKFNNPQYSLFAQAFEPGEILPVPISHSEGRFILSPELLAQLDQLTTLTYTTANPNGTTLNLAGLGNARGNVLGMMPHPERAAFLRQIPFSDRGKWGHAKKEGFATLSAATQEGPWGRLFIAMRSAVAQRVKTTC